MALIFRARSDGSERSLNDPSFWLWLRGYCIEGRAPQRLTRAAAPVLKLRDVVMLLASTQLNLTNEDIARGICTRKPGTTHGLAAGNVTRALARANAAISQLFDVRVDRADVVDGLTTDPQDPFPLMKGELEGVGRPSPEMAGTAVAETQCPFCHSRQITDGMCLGCGSDV